MPTRVDPSNTPGAPASPFTRLKPKLPARRGAGQLLNVPGGDPRAKRRTGQQLVDAHVGSQEIHRRTAALIGGASARGQLDSRSHVAAWLAERRNVLREGPRGSGLRTDIGVTQGLREVDVKYAKGAQDHLDAMRDALEARVTDFPLLPPLGSGSLPPEDRSKQLGLVREHVKDDLDQLAENAAFAMRTNDRPLADELVSVIRSNTGVEHAPWYRNPAAARALAIRADLEEWFATPRTVAGEANATLSELQEANLTALQNELNRPDAGERLPILIANGVFRWLMPPDSNQDAADRFAELAALAATPTDVMQLAGDRLVALDAEAAGPVQWGGLDRGSLST